MEKLGNFTPVYFCPNAFVLAVEQLYCFLSDTKMQTRIYCTCPCKNMFVSLVVKWFQNTKGCFIHKLGILMVKKMKLYCCGNLVEAMGVM